MDWTVPCFILMSIATLQAFDVNEAAKHIAKQLILDVFNPEKNEKGPFTSLVNIVTVAVPIHVNTDVHKNFSVEQRVNCGGPNEDSCEDKTSLKKKRYNKKRAERRNYPRIDRTTILAVPEYPEDLPAAEPILPGHTLLRPSKGMLKSSVKYPLRDFGGAAVYGNLDNEGITWGKTRDRIRYSNFRKSNGLMELMKYAIKKSKNIDNENSRSMIIVEIDPSKLGLINDGALKNLIETQVSEEEIDSNEVADEFDALQRLQENKEVLFGLRRSGRKSKSKFRDRYKSYKKSIQSSSSSSSSDSSSSELEKNPGNPYTIHKNKYMQNWLWNHEMDGDHMNINPLAPELQSMGPTGPQLFFGRKWWYFNQDDYKPMRRK